MRCGSGAGIRRYDTPPGRNTVDCAMCPIIPAGLRLDGNVVSMPRYQDPAGGASNLNLTDEQRAFVEAIRDFARRECGTREQRDALTDNGPSPTTPRSTRRSPSWGGSAPRSRRSTAAPAAARSTCACCARSSPAAQIPMGFFPVTMMSARPVELFGTDALKEEILPRIVAGTVYAIAMSEPEAGSDVGNLSCRAERVERRLRDQRAEDVDHRRPRRRPHPARVPHVAHRATSTTG